MSAELQTHQELVEKWGADNIPYSESLAFDMPEVIEGIKRMPSFYAVLVHKLNIIARASGGSWREVAHVLRVNESILRKWRTWKNAPSGVVIWQRIDTAYEVALDRLKMQTKKI